MGGVGLSVDQEARVLAYELAQGEAITPALTDWPAPTDRTVSRSRLADAIKRTGEPLAVMVAWLRRLADDETVRPLDADLDVSWPRTPDAADTALIVRLACDPACWYYEIRAALTLAERVLAAGIARDDLVVALLSLRARLADDRLHSSEFFRAKVLPWVLRLVASTTPGEMVDLTFVDSHDGWAPRVKAAVQAHPDPPVSARALLHLGSPRGSKPSKKWWSETAVVVTDTRESQISSQAC